MAVQTKGNAGPHAAGMDEGLGGSEAPALPGSYVIQPRDTAESIAARKYSDLGVDAKAAGVLLDQFLVEQRDLPRGKCIADSAGARVILPSPIDFALYIKDRADRMSRSGQRERVGRAIIANAEPAGPRVQDAPRRGIGARRQRIGTPPGAEPQLTPIPDLPEPSLVAPPRIPPDLLHACRTNGVSSDVLRAVAGFCAAHHVDLNAVDAVFPAGTYHGIEAGEALKATAVTLDAIEHRLIDEDRRPDVQYYFISAIRRGTVHFKPVHPTKKDPDPLHGSYAQYDWHTNTIRLPPGGLDLDALASRAVFLHEAEHAVQDAQHEEGNRYQMELDGHEAEVQYLFRSTGVLREDAHGRLYADQTRYQALIEHPSSVEPGLVLDPLLVNHVFGRVFAAALQQMQDSNGEERLHSIRGASLAEVMQAVMPTDAMSWDQAYLEAQQDSVVNWWDKAAKKEMSPQQIDAVLRRPYQKDGL